jgi:hypothetical protein
MSTHTKGSSMPPRVVQDLDGKRAHMAGYAVPLDFDATQRQGVPAGAVCRRLHPRATAAGKPDRLRQSRSGLPRAGDLRSRMGVDRRPKRAAPKPQRRVVRTSPLRLDTKAVNLRLRDDVIGDITNLLDGDGDDTDD